MLYDYNGANKFLASRLNAVTNLSSKEIAAMVPEKVRANVFFSAKVAEGHIVSALRNVSDSYSRGEINLAEARTRLKGFLASEGSTPGGVGAPPAGVDKKAWEAAKEITNLASTARLNLLLRQNAAMANAVGVYQVGRDADVEKRWPYWKYIAISGARTSHAELNGRVFRKDDPVWHRIFPPWEFNCRCQVEDCDAEEAKASGGVVSMAMPDIPKSGYAFDPRNVFSVFDLSRIEQLEIRREVRLQLEAEFGDQVSQKGNILRVAPNQKYVNWSDKGLLSASKWEAEPRPAKIDADAGREMLEKGVKVKTPEGKEVLFDGEILRHWREDGNAPKLKSDEDGRLSILPIAQAAVERPNERWKQETQETYLKIFTKENGGKSGVLVAVTNNGKVRSYIFKNARDIDRARRGLDVKEY